MTASGAVEHPLGSTKSKVMFTLARGTEQECKAAIYVTIVDTSAYDALLGIEFITTMGGAYDTWTELFEQMEPFIATNFQRRATPGLPR